MGSSSSVEVSSSSVLDLRELWRGRKRPRVGEQGEEEEEEEEVEEEGEEVERKMEGRRGGRLLNIMRVMV